MTNVTNVTNRDNMSRLVTVTVQSVTKCHGHVTYVSRFVTKIVEIWLSQKFYNLMKFPISLKQHSNSCKQLTRSKN